MGYPKVCLVIVNWNGLPDTVECLNSLTNVTYPNYGVVLVDNGSSNEEGTVLTQRYGHQHSIISLDSNYGLGIAINAGMKYAIESLNADYLLLLNNDVVVDPEFIGEMVKVAEQDTEVGLAGAKTYFYDEPERIQLVWGSLNLWKGQAIGRPRTLIGKTMTKEYDRGQYDEVRDIDWVNGCCFLVKADAVRQIGMLDEGYFVCWEEIDYCLRMQRAGFKVVYVPKAKVWHKGNRSTAKTSGFIQYYNARNRFRFMRKHATKMQFASFFIYFLTFVLWARTLYYIVYERNLSSIMWLYRGVRDGLRESVETSYS
ncbi:glycosyltransferase family 2 protein [Chloroflexota bacterium]